MIAALVLAVGLLPVRAIGLKVAHRPVTWRTLLLERETQLPRMPADHFVGVNNMVSVGWRW